MPFAATRMDLEMIILSNTSQKDKYYNTSMWNLKKMMQMNLLTKHKLTHRQKTLRFAQRERGREGELGVWN